MKKSPDIQIENLTLNFASQVLFNDFTMRLSANRWTCILGKSGVGKTTLLKFLAHLIQSNQKKNQQAISGRVHASDNKPIKGRFSYMAQQDLLMPWLTAFDNTIIGFHLRCEKLTDGIKNKALHLFQRVGLAKEAIHRYPYELSGGMRQRVAIIRTLMEDQPIIFMDEPFSRLDAITRLALQDLAIDLLKDRTVLLVTHDPLEALRLGDIIYVLQGLPAILSKPITLNEKPPRNPASHLILQEQIKLLKLLSVGEKVKK